ncbi:two-component sensor histidine kinase [Vibrio ishigakensis]|uniref:histidine kinase n=1 Tax=Vibrio ishigakensis TaxID=1481914 RepID=A0A0B8NUT9_9VIBR|nr:two-component sensor histidine kinase [Vibrio ishigakensis]
MDQVSVPNTPFLLVLNNLISNSIKHGDNELTKIEVSAAMNEENNYYHIEVSDDGPGIPTRFHDKVFELFQSLKPKDEIEGSGLGLSMVQRVVEQYKGSVELDSNPDITRGTTVRFSWPCN